MTEKPQEPAWWQVLAQEHQQGVARVFVFDGNVNDLYYYPDQTHKDVFRMRPHPFRDFLIHLLAREGEFGPILSYSSTKPLTLHYLERTEGLELLKGKEVFVDVNKLAQAIRDLPPDTEGGHPALLPDFARKVETSRPQMQDHVGLLYSLEPLLAISNPKYFKMALILDYFEKITTWREEASQYHAEEIIRRWALWDALKQSQNLIIGLTLDRLNLPILLRDSKSLVRYIEIPLPEDNERRQFLEYWSDPLGPDGNLGSIRIDDFLGEEKEAWERAGKSNEEIQRLLGDPQRQAEFRDSLAHHSQGFTLLDLEKMVRLAKVRGEGGLITHELWRELKATLIKEESGGLAEEVVPRGGFETVGGLQYAKDYFIKVGKAIAAAGGKEEAARFVPKGILLVGPPGTGKSILAEALAGTGQMTMVKMGNIQDKYVGESEKRMNRFLQIMEAMAPVVVYVDEIDQMIGRRHSGPEGDSGVQRRLFGQLLAFMGDNRYRGKVLWVGATNRPDLLDPAYLSRFDTVMAILPPYDLEERRLILEVMEKNIKGIRYTDDVRNNLEALAEPLYGLSGRDIETIVRRAAEEAGSADITRDHMERAQSLYKCNADRRKIDEWTVRSLIAVNFVDRMPSELKLYPEHLRPYVQRALEEKSNQPLEVCLARIANHSLYSEESAAGEL